MLKINLFLKDNIKHSGKTQGEIAKESGISEARLSRIIHGYTKPRNEEIKTIAEILGVKSEEIFQ